MTPSRWQIEQLTFDDAAEGLTLSTEADWNQTTADWTFLLRAGQGFGIRDGGRLVATSVALPYPPDFGWVSMVLVTKDYRRQGLAATLLQSAFDFLLARNLVPMLDATPAGKAVYAPMGFEEVERIDRWFRPGSGQNAEDAVNIEPRASLDLAAFGADRAHLLKDIAARDGSLLIGGAAGYAVRRRGRLYSQIGPVVAENVEDARRLLRTILAMSGEPLVIDVPARQAGVGAELAANGFSIQRPLYRMARNGPHGFGDLSLCFAIAGPEFG